MSVPDATGLRCVECNARDPRMHPAKGDGGEVISLCENEFHRSTPSGREAYDRGKNALRMQRMTMMAPGENVGDIAARVVNESKVVELPGVPGTGPGSDIAIMMEHGSVGAGGFIPNNPATTLRMREGDQPLPTGNDLPVIHDLVIEDLRARLALGIRRYGQPLQPFNGRASLRDAYEEILDLAVYLRQAVYEAEGMSQGVIRPVQRPDGAQLFVHLPCQATTWWNIKIEPQGPRGHDCATPGGPWVLIYVKTEVPE